MDRREALAPGGTIDAMKDWLKETEQPAVKININGFNRIAPEIIKFIKGESCDLSEWVHLVGGGYNSAVVYDSEGVLFEVPPIMEQQDTVNNHHPSQNVQAIMTQYGQLMASSPIAAVNYLGNAFRNLDTGAAIVTEKTISKWNALLSYYNEELLKIDVSKTVDEESNLTSDTDYDEDEEL